MKRVFSLMILASLWSTSAAYGAGDMLQPNEVQTTGISTNPANDSGLFLGAGLGLGQARTTEDKVTPGLALLGSFEPGYQFNTGSWSRMEVSAQILAGTMSFRNPSNAGGKSTLNVATGLLAKFGYGYSIGNKLFGLLRLGGGPLLAKYEGRVDGTKITSDGTLSGLGILIGWDAVMPMTSALDGVIGLDWLHAEFDVNDVKANGAKYVYDHSLVLNVPQIYLGLRLRL